MDKEQPDSLATVAVVSEKMQQQQHHHQAHSNYAPSEVYSTAEPPPAYMRPNHGTAVQIARIAAFTLVAMSVILGSFILAGSWVQARASCTPESIAAMQAELRVQRQQPEFLKHLQPEALVQESNEAKPVGQNLEPKREEPDVETRTRKGQRDDENGSKSDSDSEDDYDDDDDDDGFPPVHIKLPLQLDLDELAGTLIQEARSRVSCVVERRRADQVMDGPSSSAGANNPESGNGTDSRYQRLSGERVAIVCESGNPAQEQQDEMLTPIIIPLGTVQVPVQGPESNPGYHRYQVPDMQRLPLSDTRGFNHVPIFPSEMRNVPQQLPTEMRPPPRFGPQIEPQSPLVGPQMEVRRIPIEVRQFPVNSIRGMRPPMPQEQQQQQQQVPVMYRHVEQTGSGYGQEQGMIMMPPPAPQPEAQVHEQQMQPFDRTSAPLEGIPFEIRRIIQQVPLEIKNIIEHITGESRPMPVPVAEGGRRGGVQELKPFPEGGQPLALPLPEEVRNLLENRQRADSSEQQQQQQQEEDNSEEERNFPVPPEIRNIIHQVVEGNAFPVPRFALPLRPVESLEIPVEARAEVTDNRAAEQEPQQQRWERQEQEARFAIQRQQKEMQQQQQQQVQQQQQQQEQQEDESRPHYVQPRSVRSIPEAFTHRREKRVRRCACDCAC